MAVKLYCIEIDTFPFPESDVAWCGRWRCVEFAKGISDRTVTDQPLANVRTVRVVEHSAGLLLGARPGRAPKLRLPERYHREHENTHKPEKLLVFLCSAMISESMTPLLQRFIEGIRKV